MRLKSLFSKMSPDQEKPKVFVDASAFNPDQPATGETVILTVHNRADEIHAQVTALLHSAAAVIVIDQNSTDNTPFRAAEAGAVVIRQAAGQPREAAMREALRLARRMGTRVRLCSAGGT